MVPSKLWPSAGAFERRAFLAALLLYLCTAWFSTGFHAADEHYQVIAFAEAKLGLKPATPLPWEYHEGIRSALLPAIAWAVIGLAKVAGISSPFVPTFVLRAITALFALFAVRYFIRSMQGRISEPLWKPFVLLSFFIWFLPFQYVRFTGETWSGLFILLALAMLLDPRNRKYRHLKTGALLGLAFICRPPTLALALGVLLWLAVIERTGWRNLAAWCIGLVGGFNFGIGIDHWFYAEPVFTIWNYAKLGFLGSPDHPFMHFAWWYYPAWIVKYGIPPIGAALLLAFGVLVVLKPRNLLIWAITPFLLLHLFLPHKDLRFLYPLAPLAAWLLVKAWQELWQRNVLQVIPATTWRLLLGIIALMNLIALAVVATSPAAYGSARLAAQLHERAEEGPIKLYYAVEQKDQVWPIYIPQFYLPPTVLDSIITDPCMPLAHPTDSITLLITEEPVPTCASDTGLHWALLEYALPKWKRTALRAYELEDVRQPWALYERRKMNRTPVSSTR